MKVTGIRIYPIKSLGTIELEEAVALKSGLQWDRRWMLVDSQNIFMTQRKLKELCLFKQEINKGTLLVHKEESRVTVPLRQEEQKLFTADIWGHATPVFEVGSEISEWFSEHLKQAVKLVRMNLDHARYREKEEAKENVEMNLADGYPILILGSASLDYLNGKLQEPVGMDRFRPNIIVDTSKAHEEDEWKDFEIGEASFHISHPCARCLVTTINQRTAEKGKEPLRTLAGYRKVGERVNFGANTLCKVEGLIRLGDSIRFLE